MKEFSSFRDPSGFVFYEEGTVFRQVNHCYGKQYDHLMQSGLYETLVSRRLLIAHETANVEPKTPDAYCVIRPERIPLITYPYEWSFGQLQDAALATLNIHKCALEFGMILKDASAYNIQFDRGTSKLIDTLSFDFYEAGTAWVAYGQFCRHFLAPLLLMKYVDLRLLQLLRNNIDGIPLDLADQLLKGKGGFAGLQHIHWHAQSIGRHTGDGKAPAQIRPVAISKFNHVALIDSLIRTIEQLSIKNVKTEWMDYYSDTNYSPAAQKSKETIVAAAIRDQRVHTIWDFGANDGRFSRIALESGAELVAAFDSDPLAVERNYQQAKADGQAIVPLLYDFTNPSPGIGFANRERLPIHQRMKPDCIVALAIIHHLAISNNLPLETIAEWMASLTDTLIIEFVPKEDSQVQVLLATRCDIFSNYNPVAFETAFGAHFSMVHKEPIQDSLRTIYVYKKGM